MKTFVTFGQDHTHKINGEIFDKDCIAIVDGNRAEVFRIFGQKFCFEYPEKIWNDDVIKYFPRGYITVKNEKAENGSNLKNTYDPSNDGFKEIT